MSEPAVLPEGWEMVIGLEVHVELATATKLFCGCANSFGDAPNTNICPTCLGLPGSLPVANEQAVEYAMQLGRALNCTVSRSIFARKNYFYPDMPKDFQTTQYEEPTNSEGFVVLPDGTSVGVERAHIEEDTGKSTHLGGGGRIHDATATLVDYNRAGVPLVEIVSHPVMHDAETARAYVAELRDILLVTGVSDARMEEGSMRVDANVSVRPVGSDELRTRCEVKNINSLRSLGRAINYEARRHVDLWTNGESPRQETRHWDEDGGRSTSGRSKEDADDYRYFACPDLPPLVPTQADIDAIDAAMPALPAARRAALAVAAGVLVADTALTVERGLDVLVIAAIEAGADPTAAMKHADQNLSDGQGQLTPATFAALVAMESEGTLSSTQVKTVLGELVTNGGEPADIAATMGFEAMDTSELETLLDGIIDASPDEWARFVEGDRKVQGHFVGQIMKATQGKADGKVVNQLMTQRANQG
ncbi:MAG: Asp-tRNA(Asn)/Glu-tRNA(Gln) amidotransferase subunit GatB [Acidimicrobiaceae bacterium]|nr:Asp-tRNA(Asn)/Glu-tRNA(Gln) amidotransferase subunit GatB [Acidimicrobiaceae bacterium]MDC1390437.1 Asp-tRNA(Asn)/Glu-tRNA(Gln) amidotransferase subunit GatB [Acidimicrobiales bacterium]